MSINRSIIVGTFAALTFFAQDALSIETYTFRETKHFAVGAMPEVTLETISGDVGYKGIDGTDAELEVVIQVQAKDSAEAVEIRHRLKLTIEGEEGRLLARIHEPNEFFRWLNRGFLSKRQVDVSFHARGPKDADPMLSSVSGDVRVENVTGILDVESVSGDVYATELQGRVRVENVSGDCRIRQCAGPLTISTVSGDVEIAECGADLEIDAVSGDVIARGVTGSVIGEAVSGDVELRGVGASVTMETVSGDIRLEQEQGGFDLSTTSGAVTVHSGGKGDMRVGTVSGRVTLAIDPAGVGDVILESPSGEMDIDAPVRLQKHSRDRLSGRMGDGTATLRVHTSSGDILVSEL